MKHFSKLLKTLVLFACGGTLLAVFQNCGAMDSGFSPLYDSNYSSVCLGVNCQLDVNTAIFKTNTTGILLDANTGASTCDSSNCFDLGGFCETGGYPGSVFIYRWTLAGAQAMAEVRTTSTCDENGRFHVQVRVPAGYDWTKANNLYLYMKVIDSNNVELVNPSGSAQWNYIVTTRS